MRPVKHKSVSHIRAPAIDRYLAPSVVVFPPSSEHAKGYRGDKVLLDQPTVRRDYNAFTGAVDIADQ